MIAQKWQSTVPDRSEYSDLDRYQSRKSGSTLYMYLLVLVQIKIYSTFNALDRDLQQ
jgi:hypothetical protein